MKKRYTEEQIIKAIKQHEAGAKVDDICREMGISTGTFYIYGLPPFCKY
ncbi:transposase [Shewanella algae]|nr:transposase [Shewanella algae]